MSSVEKEVHMRQVRWTKKEIHKAFDDFIKENNRLPTRREILYGENYCFPQPCTIKRNTGVTMNEFFRIYYTSYFERCQSKKYGRMSQKYWIEDFKTQFAKYEYPTEVMYNKLRAKNSPGTQTLRRIIGVSTWNEMLCCCGFPIYHERLREPKTMKCQVDFEETTENYRKLLSKLQSFMKDYRAGKFR